MLPNAAAQFSTICGLPQGKSSKFRGLTIASRYRFNLRLHVT